MTTCPAGLLVVAAPLDVELAEDTVVQPDLVVVRRDDFDDETRSLRPLLAVEILSTSTRYLDLALKRSRYEVATVPAYWVVDPETPEIVAWEWRDGAYAEVGRASGESSLALRQPYPVDIVPARLLD